MLNPNLTNSAGKKIDFNFNAGKLTCDAGLIFVQQIDEHLHLTEQLNACFADPRDPTYTTHEQRDLIAQRIYGIIEGYEDLNDHKQLRFDPALLASVKSHTDQEQPLGSASTLSRLENRVTSKEITTANKLMVELFLKSFTTPPKKIFLDFDATNDTIHGNQVGKHFNRYYDEHCFLPLYVFCGDQLLWSELRPCCYGGAHGTILVFDFLVRRIKEEWPDVEIVFRGDSGFYFPELLNYCDRFGYEYILGYSSNSVLKKMSEPVVTATKLFFMDAQSKEPLRLFWEHTYQAGTWDYARQIIVKAERLPDFNKPEGKENTRYIVTNMLGTPQYLYEEVYCARGDMENRIKEQQLMLFADRTSCHEWQANRFRLLLSSFAYILMESFRRLVLSGTEMAKAQCSTIREKLFKVGALITESVRRIVFSLPNHYVFQEIWRTILSRLSNLRAAPAS